MALTGEPLLAPETAIVPALFDAIGQQSANCHRILGVLCVSCSRGQIKPTQKRRHHIVKRFVLEFHDGIYKRGNNLSMRKRPTQNPDEIEKMNVPGVES